MREPRYAPFPADEYQARWARARQVMVEQRLDALLVTAKENVVYFTGLQTVGWDSKHRPLGAIIPAEERKPVSMVLPETLFFVGRQNCPSDAQGRQDNDRAKDVRQDVEQQDAPVRRADDPLGLDVRQRFDRQR